MIAMIVEGLAYWGMQWNFSLVTGTKTDNSNSCQKSIID